MKVFWWSHLTDASDQNEYLFHFNTELSIDYTKFLKKQVGNIGESPGIKADRTG